MVPKLVRTRPAAHLGMGGSLCPRSVLDSELAQIKAQIVKTNRGSSPAAPFCSVGRGHLYQGRFKAFPIQEDDHFLIACRHFLIACRHLLIACRHLLIACRYVERNALTAGAVERAEDWRWGSLWARRQGDEPLRPLLSEWPVDRPKGWVRLVNRPMTKQEADSFQICIARNRPFGAEDWQNTQAKRLGLSHTMRREGRPRKLNKNNKQEN